MNQGLTRKGRWEMSRGIIGRQNTEPKFDKKWRMGDETGDYRKTEYTEPKFDKIRRGDERWSGRLSEDRRQRSVWGWGVAAADDHGTLEREGWAELEENNRTMDLCLNVTYPSLSVWCYVSRYIQYVPGFKRPSSYTSKQYFFNPIYKRFNPHPM